MRPRRCLYRARLVELDIIFLDRSLLFQPLSVKSKPEGLPLAALFKAEPVTVLEQSVLLILDTLTEHYFDEHEGLLLEFFVIFLNIAGVELISFHLLIEFEPPRLLVLFEIVQVETGSIDDFAQIVSELAVVG